MKLFFIAVMAAGVGILWGWRSGNRDEAARHSAIAGKAAPMAGVAWLVASALAWASRDRIRKGTGHASPTAAWIAKRAVAASLVTLAVYGLSPVGWSAIVLYVAVALGAAGWGVYLANLPLKL